MKKSLLLVYPKSFTPAFGDMRYVPYLTKRSGLMPVSLPTVASLTPEDWDIKIVDENIEPIDFKTKYDIVGITGYHTQIHVAEKLATKFRENNSLVVCGGPSVSLSPERWKPFSDVLIIGEAEMIWPRFIDDYSRGKYNYEYRGEKPSLDLSPIPNYSFFSKNSIQNYYSGIVQTSRGCPFDCEFCDAIVFLGRKQRYKPAKNVLQEVQQLHNLGFRVIFLSDENFAAGRKQAKEILSLLKPWNLKQHNPAIFSTPLSVNTVDDEVFLEMATESGLNRVVVGIETPNVKSLQEVGKLQNVNRDLLADVRTFHEHGIVVMAQCMVGFDNDDETVFQHQFDFQMKAGVMSPQVYPLHAADSTPLKKRIVEEGRYFDSFSSVAPEFMNLYNTFTMYHKQMTPKQIQAGTLWLIEELYKPQNVLERTLIFFDQFENSPKRKKLKIPRQSVDLISIEILARLFKYATLNSPKEEKRMLWELMKNARASSHPQSFGIAAAAFLIMKNVHEILKIVKNNIGEVPPPLETQGSG